MNKKFLFFSVIALILFLWLQVKQLNSASNIDNTAMQLAVRARAIAVYGEYEE